MTDQQPDLDTIEARANAATPGPWERYAEYGPTFFANVTGEYLRGVGDLNFGVGDQADADEEFVKHAREDVEALVAEVRRLHKQRQFLIDQLRRKDARSGDGDRALREFLAPAPAAGESGSAS